MPASRRSLPMFSRARGFCSLCLLRSSASVRAMISSDRLAHDTYVRRRAPACQFDTSSVDCRTVHASRDLSATVTRPQPPPSPTARLSVEGCRAERLPLGSFRVRFRFVPWTSSCENCSSGGSPISTQRFQSRLTAKIYSSSPFPPPNSTIRRTAVVDKTVGATPLKRIHEFTDNSRNLIRFVA